ncbi:MAG: hypothetical protein A3B65_07185 [Acidobacteria bacterium RIFCSPHIGHO2_02_FULL_67_57]|nr:MAG: hypothetical protein A3B65_07185 [Acidobacteria bacterium RIFCSPHIGHO2_02_FULL_67_57]
MPRAEDEGQQKPPATPAPPVSAAADAKAKAYYHFTLAHLYEELAQLYRRGEYQRQAIDEYKEALKYDPNSAILAVQLAEAYRRSGRIRDAVVEAKQVLSTDPDNLAAHRLLGHIYFETLGELGSDSQAQPTLRLAVEEFEHITRLAPDDSLAWLNLARLYRMDNDPRQAEAALQKLLAMEPESEEGLSQLALLYSDQGDFQKAIELLEGAAAQSSSDKLLSALAYAYEQANDLDSAVQTYRRALQENDDPELRQRLAELLLRADRLEEALAEYQALAEGEPGDAELQLRLSQIYRHQRRFAEAQAALARAQELAPDSLEIGFNESLLYEAQGDFRAALGVLSEMVARLTNAAGDYSPEEARRRAIVLERLGSLHRQMESFDDAVEVFRLLLPLGEEEARRGYAQIIETQRQVRRLEAALATAQEALERFPEDSDLTLQRAGLLADRGDLEPAVAAARNLLDDSPADREVYLTLAQIYDRHKRYPEAEAALAEAEKLSRPGAEIEYIHFLRGALYERQEKYDLAEESFRRVLAMNPKSAVTLNYLGYMFADKNMKLEESVALIQRALELDPYNGAYLDSLGWAYFRLGRLDQAEEYLVKALERLSRDPTIHDHLGDVYYKTGRLPLAEKAWERAREEWQRTAPTELDPKAFARLEEKLQALKNRLAQEGSKKAPQ